MYGLNDIKNTKGIHIAHLNVRSLMNKWETFKMQFADTNMHIIGMSESWLNDLLPSNLFTLSIDFTLLRNDRKWNDNNSNTPKRGGGVGLFINSKLNYCGETYANMNCSSKDIESQWISIKQPHCKEIIIGNIYRPPQGNIDVFIETLDENISYINIDRVELFIMGDFNIDFSNRNDANCKKLVDFIKPLGLRQLIKNTTRPSMHKESCIDLIITNADTIERSGVLDINISDHLMVHCTRKQLKLPKTKCNFTGRSYRNYNREVFQQNIKDANWDDFDQSVNVTNKWDLFEIIIRESIDEMCPLKVFRIKQKKEPWITNELIELIKDKDVMLKRARKRKDQQLWNEARIVRNHCIRRLRDAKAEFIKENLENNMSDQKKFWKNIQDVLPSNKKNGNATIKLVDKTSGQQINEKDTASYINDFFVNIGPNLAKNCNTDWKFRGKTCKNKIDNINTDTDEVIRLCKAININKSSCIEHLSSHILRDAFLAVPMKLAELFNLSFNTAEIQKKWKIAKVTPLRKAGNSTDVSNLRPVSLLPITSKLIEKIVHNRIYQFLEQNNILDEKQGGFRPNYSTCNSTASFINDIYTAMNDNNILIATYIDAMKAFDTVNHDIILKKAEKYGIVGQVLDWLTNYLRDRFQCTLANNTVSNTEPVTCGVPQGSVCGPLLFLIYINDLSGTLNSCKVSLYADDTVIYVIHKNVQEALLILQNDLNNLVEWCTDNKVTINSKKTK